MICVFLGGLYERERNVGRWEGEDAGWRCGGSSDDLVLEARKEGDNEKSLIRELFNGRGEIETRTA